MKTLFLALVIFVPTFMFAQQNEILVTVNKSSAMHGIVDLEIEKVDLEDGDYSVRYDLTKPNGTVVAGEVEGTYMNKGYTTDQVPTLSVTGPKILKVHGVESKSEGKPYGPEDIYWLIDNITNIRIVAK